MALQKIDVQGTEVALMVQEREDYISLTGIAKYRNAAEPFAVINNWMRSRSTIEFLGLWERLSNPNFKPLEFERFRKEFQRLKDEETKKLGWNLRRDLAKINYRIHTDAIEERLVPKELTRKQIATVYASEADMLNMALFSLTAQEWRLANPDKKGNMRDYANVAQDV